MRRVSLQIIQAFVDVLLYIMRFSISMTSSARGGPFSARVDAAAAAAGFDGGNGAARYGRAFYRDFAVGGADTK